MTMMKKAMAMLLVLGGLGAVGAMSGMADEIEDAPMPCKKLVKSCANGGSNFCTQPITICDVGPVDAAVGETGVRAQRPAQDKIRECITYRDSRTYQCNDPLSLTPGFTPQPSCGQSSGLCCAVKSPDPSNIIPNSFMEALTAFPCSGQTSPVTP